MSRRKESRLYWHTPEIKLATASRVFLQKLHEDAHRTELINKATDAMSQFVAQPDYKALWNLHARLNELMGRDPRKPFMWAALSGDKVLATGTHGEVVAKAAAAGVPDPVLWLVTETAKYSTDNHGIETYCPDGGMCAVRQRCQKCLKVIPLYSAICPLCEYIIMPRLIPGSE